MRASTSLTRSGSRGPDPGSSSPTTAVTSTWRRWASRWRGPEFFDLVLRGRPGAARLVADTGAPVIPIGVWGTERVWPRSSRLPNVTNVLSPPTVRVRVGAPVEGLRGDIEADTKRIMAAIAALLPDEARVAHEPTREELALTYPPGR